MKKTKILVLLTTLIIAVLLSIGVVIAASNVVVSPDNMNGWVFFDDNGQGGSGSLVTGPATPPSGVGSANLSVTAPNQGYALGKGGFEGIRFDQITSLEYWTYQNQTPQAISLQFNVDYDLTDTNTSWQGRLVFEPYQEAPAGTVQANTWQVWSPLNGSWWATGLPGRTVCPQSNPCTWSEILASFPNAGFNSTQGMVVFKAGSGWTNFVGYVDKFTIGINGNDTTYDFEPYRVADDKDTCKSGGWQTLKRADGSSFKNQGDCIQYVNTGK